MADGLQSGLRAPGPESGSKGSVANGIETNSRGGRLDPMRIAFWAAVALGVAEAGVAITSGPSIGQAGAILLLLVVASGMVLFLWMSRGAGRRFGPFPERGAVAAAAVSSGRTDVAMIDALDEAALITDKSLSPIRANAAYISIMQNAGMLGESDRPPVMSRLFGADPMLSAPMFRLSKAAGAGQGRREELPATGVISQGTRPVRYEASVGPMAGGHV